MNGTRDTNDITATGDDGELGPQEAAALLAQTKRQARRKFNPNPPLLSLLRAVVVLGAYGAVWLSVRDQHPYKGPSGGAIAILYLLVAIVIVASVVFLRRATTGVQGPSRARPAEITVLAAAWILVYVFMGALEHAGASHAIAYGIYPATAPLIIVGVAGAGLAQARADWPMFAGTLTVAVIATIAAYFGPAGAWLVAGIALAAALLVHATATAWRQRA
ncbi:MAG TPA: hypothetical protein VEC76_17845 [Streptosporangiaceae bacterium]|nr:hypothetical protein [Streptosporangiaceae bacterium]